MTELMYALYNDHSYLQGIRRYGPSWTDRES
jgi:hypothetical protein